MIVTAAENGPVAEGWKCPWIVQFAPIARLDPQVLANTNEDASVPVTAMLVIDKTEIPVFVSVTAWDWLGVFATTEPYERLVADSVTGTTPVPLNAILCGEPPPLYATVTAAVTGPLAVGAKCP